MSGLIAIVALLLDQLLGEAKRFHPLIGFGNLAVWLEQRVNTRPTERLSVLSGLLCLTLLILPISSIIWLLQVSLDSLGWIISLFVLYWALGLKSLIEHIQPVRIALSHNNIDQARHSLSRIVSRDTKSLDQQQITTAAVETTLENGCDAVFGALFWFLVGGAPMAVLYRLINTLDAMWGYRTSRYEFFGKSAAILDDIANYLPARLTALSYAICGNFKTAINSWFSFSKLLESPNAGPVMAAGAGSLNVRLGGPTPYQGLVKEKPFFGGTNQVHIDDLQRANKLVINAVLLWCACLLGSSTFLLLTSNIR